MMIDEKCNNVRYCFHIIWKASRYIGCVTVVIVVRVVVVVVVIVVVIVVVVVVVVPAEKSKRQ